MSRLRKDLKDALEMALSDVDTLRKAIKIVDRKSGAPTGQRNTTFSKIPTPRRRTDWSGLQHGDAIERAMKAARGPVHPKDLFEALRERGKNMPFSSLTGTLTNDKRFKNVGRSIWELRNWVPRKKK